MSIFRTDAPTFAEILEVRAERQQIVTQFLSDATPELLTIGPPANQIAIDVPAHTVAVEQFVVVHAVRAPLGLHVLEFAHLFCGERRIEVAAFQVAVDAILLDEPVNDAGAFLQQAADDGAGREYRGGLMKYFSTRGAGPVSLDDALRLARLGVIASMQPIHATSDWEMSEQYWGDRAQWSYNWRQQLDAGARLAFGSDAPIEPFEPMKGIFAAVTRRRPATEADRASVAAALRRAVDACAAVRVVPDDDEKARAERARRRFEARNERLQREQQERDAELARQKAAAKTAGPAAIAEILARKRNKDGDE
mgnify:CR=1 FL=1